MGTPELRERGEEGTPGFGALGWTGGVDRRRAGSGCCSGIENGVQIVLSTYWGRFKTISHILMTPPFSPAAL
jgi:hypothetical protein